MTTAFAIDQNNSAAELRHRAKLDQDGVGKGEPIETEVGWSFS
jgi:hypothetical protein